MTCFGHMSVLWGGGWGWDLTSPYLPRCSDQAWTGNTHSGSGRSKRCGMWGHISSAAAKGREQLHGCAGPVCPFQCVPPHILSRDTGPTGVQGLAWRADALAALG